MTDSAKIAGNSAEFPAGEHEVIIMMKAKKAGFLLILVIVAGFAGYSQKVEKQELLIKQQLRTDYSYLEIRVMKLESPIARAWAKIEIARGLWWLDKDEAKKLLIDAFKLTIPDKDEEKVAGKEIERGVFAPSEVDLTRKRLRNEIFEIASREKQFSNQLAKIAEDLLGNNETVNSYSKLANISAQNGNLKLAEQYIESAINSGQFQSNIGFAIYSLAKKDREAADRLILQYLSEMRVKPINITTLQSIIFGLDAAIFADGVFDPENTYPKPANLEVVREYLNFVMDKILDIAQIQQNSLREMRGTIVSLWRRISVYTPELVSKFRLLEQASRLDPKSEDLPEPVTAEKQRDYDESVIKKAEESRNSEDIERAIKTALRLKDFSKARELAELFQDKRTAKQDEKKTRKALNEINAEESLHLIGEKKLAEAERVAQKIDEPRFVLKIYSLLIQKFAENKNKTHAKDLAYETARRLKTADDYALLPYSLGQLVKVTSKVDSDLAFVLLDEMVRSLNKRELKVEKGEIGFAPDLFVQLAKINESRSQQTAEVIKDNFQKIIALTSIYDWKTKQFMDSLKSSKQEITGQSVK